jgi:hypothetical protein
MRTGRAWWRRAAASGYAVLTFALAVSSPATAQTAPVVHDSHFHLTNYIQQGTDIRDFLKIMGTKVGRSTLFGVPLQQTWDFGNTGDFAPWYYTQTDAPLYYYSFTDAYIAMAYKSLTPAEQARLDPMITGFNPADMYAPLFAKLTPEASEKLRKGNYERLFDAARVKVRSWEKANLK